MCVGMCEHSMARAGTPEEVVSNIGEVQINTKGHDWGVRKQITAENQVPSSTRSIMRSSKSVQVTCDLEETRTGIQDFISSCTVSH